MFDETNQNLINAVYMALVSAQSVFLPPENVQKFNKEVADFFVKKALKEKDEKKLQIFCLDKAFGFMYDEENLTMASQWIFNGKIEISGETIEVELTEEQKYSILKNYYSSLHFDTDSKKELKEKAMEND